MPYASGFDHPAQDFISTTELADILSSVRSTLGREIDVLGLDACLMSMMEIGYQLKRSVRYIVGSQETVPGTGWPYAPILRQLVTKPTSDAATVASGIVDQYIRSYGDDRRVTHSALDLQRADDVASAAKILAAKSRPFLQQSDGFDVFRSALKDVQRFWYRQYVDLGDLADRLKTKSPQLAAAAGSLKDAIAGPDRLVLSSQTKGGGVKRATGVSVYFPTSVASGAPDDYHDYEALDFSKDTGWSALVRDYRTRVSTTPG